MGEDRCIDEPIVRIPAPALFALATVSTISPAGPTPRSTIGAGWTQHTVSVPPTTAHQIGGPAVTNDELGAAMRSEVGASRPNVLPRSTTVVIWAPCGMITE